MASTTAERFWAKVDRRGPDDCWRWTAGRFPAGYGALWVNGQMAYAHRISYEMHIGPCSGSVVMHRCDNPKCVNPAHLVLGTHADNVADKVRKGRHARGFMLPHTKLSAADVQAIRVATGPQRGIAARYGIHHSTVSQIKSGARRNEVSP